MLLVIWHLVTSNLLNSKCFVMLYALDTLQSMYSFCNIRPLAIYCHAILSDNWACSIMHKFQNVSWYHGTMWRLRDNQEVNNSMGDATAIWWCIIFLNLCNQDKLYPINYLASQGFETVWFKSWYDHDQLMIVHKQTMHAMPHWLYTFVNVISTF